jgi:hypothetical protein
VVNLLAGGSGAAERDKFTGDDNVEISVLYTLVMLKKDVQLSNNC